MTLATLGDYTLIEKLGEGSFGEVYLAEHTFLKKRYALKILSDSLSTDEEFIRHFKQDVSVLATLDHPSIVKIHNISFADGKYFLVMDAIITHDNKSSNLQRYLESKGHILSEKLVEMILRQIASGLDYAHELSFSDEKIVHRGLKLSNILVDPTEGKERFLITDFALSRIIGETTVLRKSYETLLKNDSLDDLKVSLQNFSFLSPEQKYQEDVDCRSDVYSFGVLSYYLITRKFPDGYFELPSTIAPDFKLKWDLFVSKCLQRNIKKRPDQLTKALNILLSTDASYDSSVDVLSWHEVERKVENAMQMSFEFSYDEAKMTSEKLIEKEIAQKEVSSVTEDIEQSNHSNELKPIIKPQEIKRPEYEPDPGAIFQKELNVSFYQPQKIEIQEVEPILTEMVIVPGGRYFRGSDGGARDESPCHKISISSFAMDIHQVRNDQFVRFLESMGGEKDCDNNDIIRLRDSRIKRSGGKLMIESGYSKHPVVGVTWYGAIAYAKWIGKRLPTESEWEIACMGGAELPVYTTGDNIDHSQANFFCSDTTVVMSYPANSYGLYDMAGNVYEWCNDWYAYNYYDTSIQEPENPTGPQQGVYRVLRGGCWKSLKEDLRCSHRHRNNPGAVNSTYGFRCAADVS
jgi:formylglycine-generating enzyme required for sulfatase activity